MTVERAEDVGLRVGARLDRLPMTRWQVLVRVSIGIVTFFDAFDQLLISYVLPVISQEWRLSPAGSTWAITAGSLGMLVGALVSGRLADRYGRVRVITASLLLYALASLALAASPSFELFLLLRFVQGTGIGGEVPVAATYIGEIANARTRGRFVLLYETVFPLGLLAASLSAIWVVPLLGWRWMFLIGALPLPAIYLIRRYVPESPRWLASRGHTARALAVMDTVERRVTAYVGRPLPDPAPVTETAVLPRLSTRAAWRELFTGRYRRRTFMLWALWFCAYFVTYGIASWLPTIYHTSFGLPLQTALTYSMLGILAAFVGAVLIAMVADRVGRRWSLTAAMLIGGVLLMVVSLAGADDALQIALWGSIAGIFCNAANIGLYLYTPELYPTRIRGLGCSLAGVWNRLGVIIGPVVIGIIYAGGHLAAVFVVLGSVSLIGAGVVGLAGEETARRPLEEVSP
jgi:putative MFS transporter